jgi:hypothetical protein
MFFCGFGVIIGLWGGWGGGTAGERRRPHQQEEQEDEANRIASKGLKSPRTICSIANRIISGFIPSMANGWERRAVSLSRERGRRLRGPPQGGERSCLRAHARRECVCLCLCLCVGCVVDVRACVLLRDQCVLGGGRDREHASPVRRRRAPPQPPPPTGSCRRSAPKPPLSHPPPPHTRILKYSRARALLDLHPRPRHTLSVDSPRRD